MIYTIRILFKAFIKMCVTSLLFAWLSMFVMSCRHLAAITVHNVQITQIGQLFHSFFFFLSTHIVKTIISINGKWKYLPGT